MSIVRLLLLAGGTGVGKSDFAKKISPEMPDVVMFDFDQLMHDATPFAFPYCKGGVHRWSHRIWNDTKDCIDAKAAMLRAVQHNCRYESASEGTFEKAMFFGIQLGNDHWRDVAKYVVESLTEKETRTTICLYEPPPEVVIRQRKQRNRSHDKIDEAAMRKSLEKYAKDLDTKPDCKIKDADEGLAEFKRFFS